VHVSGRLLEVDDGPMLALLKGFHQSPLNLPRRRIDLPDQERLEARFERFLAVAS
jgi:hypothetical protein